MTRNFADEWEEKAQNNIDHWGNQEAAVLLMALAEEVAEVADDLLATGEEPITKDSMYSAKAARLLSEVRRSGFACRTFLEQHFEDEDGNPLSESEMPDIYVSLDDDRVLDEVNDVGPLVFQLAWALSEEDQ